MHDDDRLVEASRSGAMTGSLVGAALGMNPHCSPLKAYHRWMGRESPHTLQMETGRLLERMVIREGLKRMRFHYPTGDWVQPKTLVHPKMSWVAGTPDVSGYLRGDSGQFILEAKVVGGYAWDGWEVLVDGEWVFRAPKYVVAQCQWYLALTGARLAVVAAYRLGSESTVELDYLHRDDAYIGWMLSEAEQWLECARGDEPHRIQTRWGLNWRSAAEQWSRIPAKPRVKLSPLSWGPKFDAYVTSGQLIKEQTKAREEFKAELLGAIDGATHIEVGKQKWTFKPDRRGQRRLRRAE